MTVAEQAMHEGPELLTPAQLATKLNVSLKSVTKWTQARRIQGQRKIGRLWRYDAREVERGLLREQFLLPTKG